MFYKNIFVLNFCQVHKSSNKALLVINGGIDYFCFAMSFRRLILILAFAGLLSACGNDIPTPEGFGMPEFRSVKAEGAGRSYTLIAELSSTRVDACGFILTPPTGDPVRLTGTLEDHAFKASAKSLQLNQKYTCTAFFSAGGREIRSKEFSFTTGGDSDIVYIEDEAFRTWLIGHFDTNGDGELQKEEAAAIKSLTLGPLGIKSLQGIEFMPFLTSLDCSGNLITELDVSANHALTRLDCSPMEDAAGNNLLDVVYIDLKKYQMIDYVTEIEYKRSIQYVPAGTIVCVRYDNDPLCGTPVDTGGARGIVFSVDRERSEALVVSVDEISGKPWNTAVCWCEAYGDGSWHMPDISELNLLHKAFYPVTKALIAGGFTPLYNENKCYWSSTVISYSDEFRQRERIWDGTILTDPGADEHINSTANFTRAVKRVDMEEIPI